MITTSYRSGTRLHTDDPTSLVGKLIRERTPVEARYTVERDGSGRPQHVRVVSDAGRTIACGHRDTISALVLSQSEDPNGLLTCPASD